MCHSTDDQKVFGQDAWVYCKQHLRPHETGWCTVNVDQKIALEAKDYASALAESRKRGFEIYGE